MALTGKVKLNGELAWAVDACFSLDEAIRRSNTRATTTNHRHRIKQSLAVEGNWIIWELLKQPVGHCSQCGHPYRARACGPSHALVAHEQGIVKR